MFKILKKEKLAESISRILVEAPHVARAAKPGQFVVVIPTENAERIPLTIADTDTNTGAISMIFQIVGATTKVLDSLKEGDTVAHLLGPLGVPSHIDKYGTVVVIGGGVGIAEIYPYVKALKEAGNKVITIIGARCEDLLIYRKELGEESSELKITTDDGSC
ncbi:MAG: sulfide/dihydroorotate dehydrogenase-like FAD/NAD-binding protein, partial [Candidatus Margulisiibacteriota bacterium]